MEVSRADMTTMSPISTYVLGSTDAEHERLIRQAAILDPYTERFFRDAGIGTAQRVLDIGSGLGDVTMLVARLVGPSGAVIGVDRDASIIVKAKARVGAAGLQNVTFMQSDVGEIESSKPFDAVVGRFILEFALTRAFPSPKPFRDYAYHGTLELETPAGRGSDFSRARDFGDERAQRR
jgi:SAM-dependent methyltransferase